MNKYKTIKAEMDFLREKFIHNYSKKKGWNPDKLSVSQMLEISGKKEYINPKII